MILKQRGILIFLLFLCLVKHLTSQDAATHLQNARGIVWSLESLAGALGKDGYDIKKFANVVKTFKPFLGALGPLVFAISGFLGGEDGTTKLILNEFKKVHERFDHLERKLDSLKHEISKVALTVQLEENHDRIMAVQLMLSRFSRTPESASLESLRKACQNNDPKQQLDWLFRKVKDPHAGPDLVSTLKKSTGYSTKAFSKWIGLILTDAVQASILDQACLGSATVKPSETLMLEDSLSAIRKIEDIKFILDKSLEELPNEFISSGWLDTELRNFLENNKNLNNEDFSTRLYNVLNGKNNVFQWGVFVYNDVAGYDNHGFITECGEGDNCHPSRGGLKHYFRTAGRNLIVMWLAEKITATLSKDVNLSNYFRYCFLFTKCEDCRTCPILVPPKFNSLFYDFEHHLGFHLSCSLLMVRHGNGLWGRYSTNSFSFQNIGGASFILTLKPCKAGRKVTSLSNSPSNINLPIQKRCGKKIVGYYTSWGKESIHPSQLDVLTHVIFAFIEMRSDGSLEIGSPDRKNSKDPLTEARVAGEKILNLANMKRSHPHLRTLFAVGGWENSQYFVNLVRSTVAFRKFMSSVERLLIKFDFDGIDVDWEYPVTGGAQEGLPADKRLYVDFMDRLRTSLAYIQLRHNRKEKYLLTFAGAAGYWTLEPGFDLPKLLNIADWVNVMTYDFFGPWDSKWGAYTGSPSPLWFGAPAGFTGKTNAHFGIKYYVCKTKRPDKIVMGVPFYGRYWHNVGNPIDGKDGMWRLARAVNGKFVGGYLKYSDIDKMLATDPSAKAGYVFHEKTKSPYIFIEEKQYFLGFENPESMTHKVKYVKDHNLGGIMIWAIDQDNDNLDMLRPIARGNFCSKISNKVEHRCLPFEGKRWWTSNMRPATNAGMCGKSGPLVEGFYPICDPDDPGYSCCGPHGFCGIGEKFCNCKNCVNYDEDFHKVTEEPIKPSGSILWYTNDAPTGKRGRCGYQAPQMPNGDYAICNPDDPKSHCCSSAGYCGNTDQHCKCDGCIDFSKNRNLKFVAKTWHTWPSQFSGKCHNNSPLINGKTATCNPYSKSYHCCSKFGWCGTGSQSCNCIGCKNYKINIS